MTNSADTGNLPGVDKGTGSQASPELPHEVALAKIGDIGPTGLLGVNVEGIDLVLVRHRGEVRAFEGRCPHLGTLLAEGELRDGRLTCRSHHWQFDVRSGRRRGDDTVCLRAYTTVLKDGQIFVSGAELCPATTRAAAIAAAVTPAAVVALPLDALPGPRGLPVIGNLHQLNRRAFHLTLEHWAERFGPIYAFRFGRRPMAVVADAALANALLKARPDDFRRSSQLERVSILGVSTQGIFMAEGERWRRQRPVISQSLDVGHLRQFFPTLVMVTERLRRRWQVNGSGAAGLDVQAELMRFTVDVTASLAFGQDINTLEQDGAVIQEHLDKIFPTIQRRLLSALPYWRYVRTAADRDVERSVKKVYDAIAGFIAAGRERLAIRPELRDKPENLLQSLLVAAEKGATEAGGFSEREVADNVLTMLLAGEDTTANSLAWVLYYLAKYPEVQARMRAEVAAVLAGGELDDYDKTRQLPYVDALVNEVMRLKPVAPINLVEALRDISVGSLALRRGQSAIILARAIAMREAEFPDAKRFNPQRWLGAEGEKRQSSTRAFMPFGSGPRLCPGRSLALLEMKAVLVMIARHFEVSAATDLDRVTERLQFTMAPEKLRIRLTAIEHRPPTAGMAAA